jgi:hypothetical protein
MRVVVIVTTVGLAAALAALSYGMTYGWASTYGGGGPGWVLALIAAVMVSLVAYGLARLVKVRAPGAGTYLAVGLLLALGGGAVGVWAGERERNRWLQPELSAAACDGAIGQDLLRLIEASGEVWPQGPSNQPMVGESSGVIGADYPTHWCWAQVSASAATVAEVAQGFGWELRFDEESGLPPRVVSSAGVLIEFAEDFVDEEGLTPFVWLGAWRPEG